MPRQDIEDAARNTTFKIGVRREIRRLERNLYPGETVEQIVSGKYALGGRGILVVTDKRVMFVKDGWFRKVSQDFSYRSISSCEWRGGIMMGTIVMFGDGSTSTITNVFKGNGEQAVRTVRSRAGRWITSDQFDQGSAPSRSQGSNQPQPPSFFPEQSQPAHTAPAAAPRASAPQEDDVVEQLEKLNIMKDLGRITAADYEAAKRKLLS